VNNPNERKLRSWKKLRSDKPRSGCYLVQHLVSYIFLSKNIKIEMYFTVLPVLYGCEAWSFTLRGERRMRVFENRVLRKIFGPWRNEIIGMWRRQRNERNVVCSTSNIFQLIKSRMRWAGHVPRMGEV